MCMFYFLHFGSGLSLQDSVAAATMTKAKELEAVAGDDWGSQKESNSLKIWKLYTGVKLIRIWETLEVVKYMVLISLPGWSTWFCTILVIAVPAKLLSTVVSSRAQTIS